MHLRTPTGPGWGMGVLGLILLSSGVLVMEQGCKDDEEEASAAAEEESESAPASSEAAPTQEAAAEPAGKAEQRPGDRPKPRVEPPRTGTEPAADEAEVDALDPKVHKRTERERRIAALKRRNEERLQERGAGRKPGPAKERLERTRPAAAAKAGRAGASSRDETTTATTSSIDPTRFLSLRDVRAITGESTLSAAGGLSGIAPSETYNSAYYARATRTKFGVSLQVWKERIRRDTNDRYQQMRRDYPNAEDITGVAPKSFFSVFGDIMTLTFADLTKRTILSVSCSREVCSPDELVSLAKAAKGRL